MKKQRAMHKNHMTTRSAVVLSLGIIFVLLLPFLMMLVFGNFGVFGYDPLIPTMDTLSSKMLIYSFIEYFTFLFLMFKFNFSISNRDIGIKKRTVTLIFGTILGVIIFTFLLILSRFGRYHLPEHSSLLSSPIMLETFIFNLFFAIIVIFISQIIYLSQKQQKIVLQYEALETENIRIRYEALKNKVDPHFFFNTLSILDSLVAIDPQKAQKYIQKFSLIFRYILHNKDVVTLNDELDFTCNYSDLMKIRYGDSLKIDFSIDEKYESYLVVSLGLQTLVENAIKHNIISKQKPLLITIETTNDGMLTVNNNYQPKDVSQPGSGIGLKNLYEMYLLKWGKGILIENTKTFFTVSLPLIKS